MDDEKKVFYEKEMSEFLDKEININWEPIDIRELGLVVRMPLSAHKLMEFAFLAEEVEVSV